VNKKRSNAVGCYFCTHTICEAVEDFVEKSSQKRIVFGYNVDTSSEHYRQGEKTILDTRKAGSSLPMLCSTKDSQESLKATSNLCCNCSGILLRNVLHKSFEDGKSLRDNAGLCESRGKNGFSRLALVHYIQATDACDSVKSKRLESLTREYVEDAGVEIRFDDSRKHLCCNYQCI
jgi:hypothetical protein